MMSIRGHVSFGSRQAHRLLGTAVMSGSEYPVVTNITFFLTLWGLTDLKRANSVTLDIPVKYVKHVK